MTPHETIRLMTKLAASSAAVPEGDAWEMAIEVWCEAFADVPEVAADAARRAHVKDTSPIGEHDPRPRGAWWPKPADLLARMTLGDADSAAWRDIRRHLSSDNGIPAALLADLTRAQASAYRSLPAAYARRQMSTADLDRLRPRFLQACREYTPPAAPAIVAFEPRRLAEHLPPEPIGRDRAREFTREVFKPFTAPPIARSVVSEDELRERARVAADIVRARMAK